MIHNISSTSESDSDSYGYTDDLVLDEDYAIIDGACQGKNHIGYSSLMLGILDDMTDGPNFGYDDPIDQGKQEPDEEFEESLSKTLQIPIQEENPSRQIDDKEEEKNPVDEEFNESLATTPEIPFQEENPSDDKEEEEEEKIPVDHDVRNAVPVCGFGRKKIWAFSRFLIRAVYMILMCAYLASMNNYHHRGLIVPEFAVESVSVFPMEHDPVSSTVAAKWNVIFNATNPSDNRVLRYNGISAEVMFGKNKKNPVFLFPELLNKFIQPWMPPVANSNSIWKTDLPDFNQTEGQQELVKVTFPTFPVTIDNDTAAALVKDVKSAGRASTGFSVRLSGSITEYNKHDKRTGKAWFAADCPLNMAFLKTGGGVMASSSEECKVTMVDWKTPATRAALCIYYSSF
ncbi:OLC1v1000894C1 [Oldenlandia corymbosa var. corymbosa]|uniref:OLC1v1000894C1 n=1 Tax=Oldenlandia corymbosa var. corymbosa TaxID=529605 RepID=A0AAV1D513_OLDCO|nr:OLC1v1000894C1 [Oldenlandia corymbosa var. corymbosa]